MKTPATSVTTPPLAVRVKKSSLICGAAKRVRRALLRRQGCGSARLGVQVQLFKPGKGRGRPGLRHPVRRQPRPPRGQPRRLHGGRERLLRMAGWGLPRRLQALLLCLASVPADAGGTVRTPRTVPAL